MAILGIIKVFILYSTSNGRTSVYFTKYRYLNRTFECRFDEGAQTAYDYLIYYRWYRYQSVFAMIASRKYGISVIRESRYCIIAFYRWYGA